MARPLPLRQGKGISSARRTGSLTHGSGSPKQPRTHHKTRLPIDQSSLIDGRCSSTSRRCFSSRGSICSFQKDDAMAGSSCHFRVLTMVSSTFTRRRTPRRRYSPPAEGMTSQHLPEFRHLRCFYSSPGTRPVPHARDRRAAGSRKHRPMNLSRGRQRMHSPDGARKACWSQRPPQRTTCLHSNSTRILADRSCRRPLF